MYLKEFTEIEKVLAEYNQLDNTYDYRTVTLEKLLEATKYLDNRFGHKEKYENAMPNKLEFIKENKKIREFVSLDIKLPLFTDETYENAIDTSQYSENTLTHAYVELEIRAKEKNPTEEFSNSLWRTWVQKVDGEWKVVGEELIKELE